MADLDRWQYMTTRRDGGLVVRSGRSAKLVAFYELGGRVVAAQYPAKVVK